MKSQLEKKCEDVVKKIHVSAYQPSSIPETVQ